MRGRAECDRLAKLKRRREVGEHERDRAIGDRRAIGALERSRDERILVAWLSAEVVAKVLAQLRVRIADAVLVILRRDHRERVRLVAPALKIEAGDLAENSGKAAFDVGLLAD